MALYELRILEGKSHPSVIVAGIRKVLDPLTENSSRIFPLTEFDGNKILTKGTLRELRTII